MKADEDFQWCVSVLKLQKNSIAHNFWNYCVCYLYKIHGIPLSVALNNVVFILFKGRFTNKVSRK